MSQNLQILALIAVDLCTRCIVLQEVVRNASSLAAWIVYYSLRVLASLVRRILQVIWVQRVLVNFLMVWINTHAVVIIFVLRDWMALLALLHFRVLELFQWHCWHESSSCVRSPVRRDRVGRCLLVSRWPIHLLVSIVILLNGTSWLTTNDSCLTQILLDCRHLVVIVIWDASVSNILRGTIGSHEILYFSTNCNNILIDRAIALSSHTGSGSTSLPHIYIHGQWLFVWVLLRNIIWAFDRVLFLLGHVWMLLSLLDNLWRLLFKIMRYSINWSTDCGSSWAGLSNFAYIKMRRTSWVLSDITLRSDRRLNLPNFPWRLDRADPLSNRLFCGSSFQLTLRLLILGSCEIVVV